MAATKIPARLFEAPPSPPPSPPGNGASKILPPPIFGTAGGFESADFTIFFVCSPVAVAPTLVYVAMPSRAHRRRPTKIARVRWRGRPAARTKKESWRTVGGCELSVWRGGRQKMRSLVAKWQASEQETAVAAAAADVPRTCRGRAAHVRFRLRTRRRRKAADRSLFARKQQRRRRARVFSRTTRVAHFISSCLFDRL